jgi:hypothetical protein
MSEGSHVSIETACKNPRSAVSWIHGDTHLENEISAQSTVQTTREYTSLSGCRVKMFFKKEHDPGIRKEIARLLLTAFEQGGNDDNETSHVSVQSIDERTGR